MNDNSYKQWNSYTDAGLTKIIGNFVKHHRLNQNKSQEYVSHNAGISRSTLSLLERGQTVSLSSLLSILRVLDLLYILDVFSVSDEISPIQYAKLKKYDRKKASGPSVVNEEKMDIGW